MHLVFNFSDLRILRILSLRALIFLHCLQCLQNAILSAYRISQILFLAMAILTVAYREFISVQFPRVPRGDHVVTLFLLQATDASVKYI